MEVHVELLSRRRKTSSNHPGEEHPADNRGKRDNRSYFKEKYEVKEHSAVASIVATVSKEKPC